MDKYFSNSLIINEEKAKEITSVCLLITPTCNPKGELRRAQLNGIGRMHVKGAFSCRQTLMNDPEQGSQARSFWLG